MRPPARTPTACATSALALASLTSLAPAALASSAATATAPAAPSAPATTAPPATPPAAVQVGGRMKITLRHVYGRRPPIAFVDQRVAVYGGVRPFVPGQRVIVRFYRDGRKVSVQEVAVLPSNHGTGRFAVGYASHFPGVLTVSATHLATPQLAALTAPSQTVRLVTPDLGFGAGGPAVRLLQSWLSRLHYAVPRGGVFDDATGRAVIAYRKMTYLSRVPYTDARMFRYLAAGAGAFHVRFPRDGKHVEADLGKQVLALIGAGGHVHQIYTMSSGKPSTPTVLGHFQVYLKTPGVNSEGMVDSNYFIRGYAIHGYPDVPTYAASHGCLRVPIPDAPSIYAWLQIGDPVDVYSDGGDGSHRVRANAGP
jgi:L,D-transpeptidase catalytic domain